MDNSISRKKWEEYLRALAKEKNEGTLFPAGTAAENALKQEGAYSNLYDILRGELERGEDAESRRELADAANKQVEVGQAATEEARKRNDALYDTLVSFAGGQQDRYTALLDRLSTGSYRDDAVAREIIEAYGKAGERASAHATADAAADNGGNPDSYAAGQAARQRLAFTDAGEEAARTYYGEQLDRLLTALRATSADVGELWGDVQENVDAAQKSAKDDLSIGADLLKQLAELDLSDKELAVDTLSSLLQAAGKGNTASEISPMQLDREYDAMTKAGENSSAAYTPVDALILLWDKYPTMHAYLLEKYEKVLNPDYSFE